MVGNAAIRFNLALGPNLGSWHLLLSTTTAITALLDGASQLPSMVERAKELGMPAIALTDHGVMYGAIELLKLCKGTDLKPIIGNEMYVIQWFD